MLRGICVRQYLIDLAKFQGNFVALVLQAYNKRLGRCFHRKSVNVALDLQLSAPDAMSFIPVYLRQAGSAIMKPHASDPFPFPPATAPVYLAQSCNFANGRADSKGLNMCNL